MSSSLCVWGLNYHGTRPKVKIVGCGGKGSDSGEGTGAGSGAGSGETPEAVEGAKRLKPPNWDAMTRNQKQYCTGVKGTGGEMAVEKPAILCIVTRSCFCFEKHPWKSV